MSVTFARSTAGAEVFRRQSSCRLEPSREIPKRTQGVPDSKPDIQIDLLTDVRCPFSLLSCIGCEHLIDFCLHSGGGNLALLFETFVLVDAEVMLQDGSQPNPMLQNCGLHSQMACEDL